MTTSANGPSPGTTAVHDRLPPSPPVATQTVSDQAQHAAVPPPSALPPLRHSRWWLAGGVLGLVVLAGLIGWGLGRSSVEDSPTALADDSANAPSTTIVPESSSPLEEAVPPGLFEGLPDDLAGRIQEFLDSLPEGAGEQFFSDPQGFLERLERQFGADLEEFFGSGGLEEFFGSGGLEEFFGSGGLEEFFGSGGLEEFFGQEGLDEFFGEGRGSGPDGSSLPTPGTGRLGLVDDHLQALGLPSVDALLPEGATLRGVSLAGGRSAGGEALELAIRFQVDGTPVELAVTTGGEDGVEGSAIDLDGTPARLVGDSVIWEAAGGVKLTLSSTGLDTETLTEMATEIDGSLR